MAHDYEDLDGCTYPTSEDPNSYVYPAIQDVKDELVPVEDRRQNIHRLLHQIATELQQAHYEGRIDELVNFNTQFTVQAGPPQYFVTMRMTIQACGEDGLFAGLRLVEKD